MAVSRRRFLAALAALPYLGKKLLEGDVFSDFEWQETPSLGDLKIRRVVGRIEITEEVRNRLQADKAAFTGWLEEEFPKLEEELDRHVLRQHRDAHVELLDQYGRQIGLEPALDFETLDMDELLAQNEAEGRYFETRQLFSSSRSL